MRVYGSLQNRMIEGGAQNAEVGMGATICMWSDRHAATIVAVDRFKTGARAGQVRAITVQYDNAKRTDRNGMSECQTYEFTRDPEGRTETFVVKRDGSVSGLSVGHRSEYRDFSF